MARGSPRGAETGQIDDGGGGGGAAWGDGGSVSALVGRCGRGSVR
jgi:hypothetical protein